MAAPVEANETSLASEDVARSAAALPERGGSLTSSEASASSLIPPPMRSRAYLISFYDRLAANEEEIEALKRQGLTSLDLSSSQPEQPLDETDTRGIRRKEIEQTLRALEKGELCWLSVNGFRGQNKALWNSWKPLLGDLFFFFEYSYEDGDGDQTYWDMPRTHRFNRRLDPAHRTHFEELCAINSKDGHRRAEILLPLSASTTSEKLTLSERFTMSLSQAAYETRRRIEHRLVQIDSIESDDPEDSDDSDSNSDSEQEQTLLTPPESSSFDHLSSTPSSNSDASSATSETSVSSSDTSSSASSSSSSSSTSFSASSSSLSPLSTTSETTSGPSRPRGNSERKTLKEIGERTRAAPSLSFSISMAELQSSSRLAQFSSLAALTATLQIGGEGLRSLQVTETFTVGPFETGDMLVRLFGMKDNDGFFTRGNVLATGVSDGLKERHRVGPLRPFAHAAKGGIRLVGTATGISDGIRCHRGFYRIWKQIRAGCLAAHGCDMIDRIVSMLDPSKPESRIVLVGHSMGACLTAVAAYQLIQRYPELAPRIFIVNFGAPLYARKGFSDWIEQNLQHRVINICCVGDPTIALPGPPFGGWFAPGPKIWISPEKADIKETTPHFQYWELLRLLLLHF